MKIPFPGAQIQVPIVLAPGAKEPVYATQEAAGADVFAYLQPAEIPTGIRLDVGETRVFGTGIFPAIPEGWQWAVRSRSGLAANNGICVLNSPGTIDSDYRKELKIILHNAGVASYTVQHGERIAQLVLEPVYKMKTAVVLKHDEEQKGNRTGGLGSTGRGSTEEAVIALYGSLDSVLNFDPNQGLVKTEEEQALLKAQQEAFVAAAFDKEVKLGPLVDPATLTAEEIAAGLEEGKQVLADLNGDGVVDEKDLSQFMSGYNKEAAPKKRASRAKKKEEGNE